jgi:hypothetical protein
MFLACIRMMRGSLLLGLLVAGGVARAQDALLFLDPADGPMDGFAFFGTAAAISGQTAAVSAPALIPSDTSGNPQEQIAYQGVVNVYTTNSERTAWTLISVLHAEDYDPPDQTFGSGVALRGRQLIVASQGALRIYERTAHGFEETDKLDFETGEFLPALGGTPLLFENGTLAFKVIQQGAAPAVVLYKVDNHGQARRIAKLTPPNDPQNLGFTSGLALNGAGDSLAIGGPSPDAQTPGNLYFYGPRGRTWKLTETLAHPSSSALGFGTGIALHGKKLIVGAPSEDVAFDPNANETLHAGAAYVYKREGNRWVQVQKLATDDPMQPVSGLVGFGSNIATNGRFVWITAPIDPCNFASCSPGGESSLYEWQNGQLVFVARPPDGVTAGGGLDFSRRYVIVGDDNPFFGERAAIFDLTTFTPGGTAQEAAPED